MAITLESISFNHNPNSATNDALTIRTNQSANVGVPEWTNGMTRPEQSRAAYIANRIMAQGLTIEATFRRQAGDPVDVAISAFGETEIAGNPPVRGHVLGDVKPKTIHFGNNDVVTARFDLNSPATNPGVGRWDIRWIWSVGTGPNQTTRHRIYTTLDSPQEPWGQPGSSFQLPWTEVLDHACEAAKGAMNLDDAAARLTTWVYGLGDNKLRYNELGSGSSCFTIEGMNAFKCTDFLQALGNGNGTREAVNCTDCATILSCFANILGCTLWQSKIGFEFQTNVIRKIGIPNLGSQEFSFHEVAWKFPNTGNATVFDCCVQLDGDGIQTDDNFFPTLSVNLPMGDPTGNDYRGRLIRPTRKGIESREWPGTRIKRRIDDGGTLSPRNIEPTELEILAEDHDFPSWNAVPPKPRCEPKHKQKIKAAQKPLPAAAPPAPAVENSSTPAQALFLKNYKFSKDQDAVAGWKPGAARTYKAEPDPVRVTEVVWSSSEACSTAAVRVLTYECKSLESARLFLLKLLAEFHVPGIKRRDEFMVDHKPVKIGDVAFAGPDELVLLFARANNVFFMQSVGKTPVSAAPLAREIDDDIAGNLEPERLPQPEKGEFRIGGEKITVGDEVLIHSEAETLAEPEAQAESKTKAESTLTKFLTPAGQVFQKGDQLCYRPLVAGEQSITILDSKAGKTTRQELKLVVAPAPESEADECSKPDIEEETEMSDTIDITGLWSSIRPTNNGVDSADMSVDGYIEITEANSTTGVVKGYYRNEEPLSQTRLLSGEVTLLGSEMYLKLNHPLGVGRKRNYVGKLVASDNQVKIVAGRYYDETVVNGNGASVPVADSAPAPEAPTTTTTFSATAASGQENGTWVATKP